MKIIFKLFFRIKNIIHRFIICYNNRRRDDNWTLEFHLVDHCNLSCSGCSHYSPVASKWFITETELEEQFKLLAPIVSGNVEAVLLLGGEPLLHPNLSNLLKIARSYFKVDNIKLYTNGLLIRNVDKNLWKVAKENNITIAISQYPCNHDYEKDNMYLREFNLNVELLPYRHKFYKLRLSEKGNENWLRNYLSCQWFGRCVQVWHGRMYQCSNIAYTHLLNCYFNTKFKHPKGTYIKIENIHSLNDIKNFRSLPNITCRYCKICELKGVDWRISRKEKTEWIVE